MFSSIIPAKTSTEYIQIFLISCTANNLTVKRRISMRILRTSLVLIFSLFITSSYANNTISGFVYSKNSGEPLPFANVILKGTTIGTATNIDGMFIIRDVKPGSYIVTASFSGYLSEEIEAEVIGDLELVFSLEETSYDINAVVVTGTRTEKTLKNVPVLTNVVSKRQIESTGATNISDALSLSLPNIRFNSSTAGGGISMQLAGLEAKYTVFLIDGEKIAGETNGNIDYNRIRTADIERIEISELNESPHRKRMGYHDGLFYYSSPQADGELTHRD